MANIYNYVPSTRGRRSLFNLSHSKTFTADMGLAYPILVEEANPGDTFKIGNQVVARMQPAVAPVLHEINLRVHYFFVPYRILDANWETFITRGKDGNQVIALPRWEVTNAFPSQTVRDNMSRRSFQAINGIRENGIGSLWDYMCFPTDIIPKGRFPLDYPRRAYWKIWNDYYRDENLQDECDITDRESSPGYLFSCAWPKDYFTSALPWQQKGTAPALPIYGFGKATWPSNLFANQNTGTAIQFHISRTDLTQSQIPKGVSWNGQAGDPDKMANFFNANNIDVHNMTTVNISDLRLAVQVQRWMEKNARCGSRYTEFLRAHWGVSPNDDRLQRPEYIGGSKQPIVISEVLQTSATDQAVSPQGNMAGHGLSVADNYCGKYQVKEHGLIMGIMTILPTAMYSQGIDRMWLRQTSFDYPSPEFVHLSEQAIERAEVIASNNQDDNTRIFGYQGRFNELRARSNKVCGQVRPQGNLSHWTLCRNLAWNSELNANFIVANPRKDFLAVQNEDAFIVSFGNVVQAIRQLPAEAIPGGF